MLKCCKCNAGKISWTEDIDILGVDNLRPTCLMLLEDKISELTSALVVQNIVLQITLLKMVPK